LGRKEISTGADDHGDQRLVAEDELAMALPANAMDKLIEGLEGLAQRGIRYPVPFTGSIADMTPGIPKVYQEMFKERKKRRNP
jgi:hypothetical protein